MGMKVKKEAKMTVSAEPELQAKFTLAVPSMGLIIMATMGTYMSSPLVASNRKASMVFLALAVLGVFFAFCTYVWRLTAGEKGVTVNAVPGGERKILYDDIKRVEVRRLNGIILSCSLIRKNDKVFVRVYPVMTNCGAFLERLRRLGVKIVEK